MIFIGCHFSVADGYEAMGRTISRFGGNTFAWFTKNPRGGKTKPVISQDVDALRDHIHSDDRVNGIAIRLRTYYNDDSKEVR